jgi:glutathione peroxidase-family protein
MNKEWLDKYFAKQWVIVKNNSIDFSQHEPISTHNSLHIYEERYEVEGETYRLLYAIGESSEPLIEMLKNSPTLEKIVTK